MTEKKIELTPVTQVLYWDEELKACWEPRIKRVRELYGFAELATVLVEMRRVYVYHVRNNSFMGSYDFLRKNKLTFFPTNKSGVYQGFSHKHQPVEKGKPYHVYGAAVKNDDLEAGELFVEYTKARPTNHLGIGGLLGYPNCCTEFFSTSWGKVSVDPMYEAACTTPDALITEGDSQAGSVTVECHPYANNMLRCFGIRLTPHLSCNLQCEDTIIWGEEWVEIMRQKDAEATDWLIELLSMPLTWNCYKGVAIVDTPIFRGVTNSDTTRTKKIVNNLGWEVEK